MGSDDGPESSQPAHRVFVSAFEIDRYEVSNEEFLAYVKRTGNMPAVWAGGTPELVLDHPVTGILWHEAQAFCKWEDGRLPTEAEWEKAARGTDGRLYPWGNDWLPARANVRASGYEGPRAIDSYPLGQSPYGILNMVGNVEEWVLDTFDPNYYSTSDQRDPRGPDVVLDHVLRGGSWAALIEHSNTVFRNSSHSVRPNRRVGFRCVSEVKN